MSKLKRKYTEPYLYGVNKETLSATKIIVFDSVSKHFLDPDGSDRDVTFTGSFTEGDMFKIKNIGSSNDLIVTNTTPNTNIITDELTEFYFDGANWNVASDESIAPSVDPYIKLFSLGF